MASTTARPLGARLPGKMPTRSPSIRRQPLVSRSMTACDKAGIELAPLMTDTLPPGGLVEAADRAHELATVGEIDVVDAGGDAGPRSAACANPGRGRRNRSRGRTG